MSKILKYKIFFFHQQEIFFFLVKSYDSVDTPESQPEENQENGYPPEFFVIKGDFVSKYHHTYMSLYDSYKYR